MGVIGWKQFPSIDFCQFLFLDLGDFGNFGNSLVEEGYKGREFYKN